MDRGVRATLVLTLLSTLALAMLPKGGWGETAALHGLPIFWLLFSLQKIRPEIGRSDPEQLFWRRIRLGLASWLGARVLFLVTPEPRPLLVSVFADVLYTGVFVSLILAVDDRPDRKRPAADSADLSIRSWPAVLLFVLGLLGYFAVIPAVLHRDSLLLSKSAMVLYLALDLYLIVRVALCWVGALTRRWRAIYGGIWLATVGMLIGDGLEALILTERIAWPETWTLEVIWIVPWVALVLTARIGRIWGPDEGELSRRRRPQRLFPREHLVAFSILLPAIHLAGYSLGLFDTACREVRMGLVLSWLIALGSLGILQYRRVARGGEHFAEVSTRQAAELARQEERLEQFSQRREVEEALRVSEEMFSKAFSASPDPLLITSLADGTYVDVNLGFEKVTGWTRAEILGRSTLDPQVWSNPEDRERFVARIREEGRVHRFEGEIITKSGGRRLVEISTEPIEIGGRDCLLSVVRDVTESRRLEGQAHRAQRMDSIGAMAGGLAHDLNNLLTPILLSIQLLGREATTDSQRRLLETLQGNAERASGVIRQLLTFARGVEGQRLLLDIVDLIREVEGIVRETFPRTMTVEFEVVAPLDPIRGDATQLHQVLLNLCLNARDASQGSGTMKVRAECRRLTERHFRCEAGPYVVLSVEDDGTGISPAVGERILEPFFSTKPVGEGSGLGLPTAVAIIESHRGFLEWESEEGRGTRFSVWLPSAVAESRDSLPALDEVGPRGEDQLVLLVDDEPSILEVGGRILRRHGYRVVTASDGREGIERFESNRDEIRVILLDMMMPHLDGPGMVEALGRHLSRIPIVGMSGLVSRIDPQVREHLAVVLSKPFTARTLLLAVSQALAEAELNSRGTNDGL